MEEEKVTKIYVDDPLVHLEVMWNKRVCLVAIVAAFISLGLSIATILLR